VIETVVTSECSVMCRPIGDLDWVGAVHLRKAVAGILQSEVDLVIDLSKVDYLDADGIGTLRNSIELVQLVGGNTRFCGMSLQVAVALEFARLSVADPARTHRPVRATASLA
jgi:anti-anti-sigma factor